MPLILCPECKTEISDQATTCPKCGHPMRTVKVKSGVSILRNVVGAIILLFIVGFVVEVFHQGEKPLMPIEVKYRRAILASGLVGIFKNTSKRQLTFLATFTNPTLHESKSFRLDLDPGAVKQIGHLEGWNFSSGDQITISHNDYQTWSGTFP